MSQENVEIVRRQLALTKGVDVALLVRDDATWTRYAAELQAIYEPDCAFAWVAQGQRVEATGVDAARQVWLDWFEPWGACAPRPSGSSRWATGWSR